MATKFRTSRHSLDIDPVEVLREDEYHIQLAEGGIVLKEDSRNNFV